MLPSASTASRPSVRSRVFPKRSTAVPPAFVDRLPPIVQLPSDASDSGNWRPAEAAASCAAASGSPDSTVIVALAVSIARTRFMRVRAITTEAPLASGTEPPHMPVLPPCGTMATPASAHARTTAATSAVVPGRTTARAAPR